MSRLEENNRWWAEFDDQCLARGVCLSDAEATVVMNAKRAGLSPSAALIALSDAKNARELAPAA